MESRIGTIRRCGNCSKESYVRVSVKECPECGSEFEFKSTKKAPDIIAFLGVNELNRRAVIDLQNKGLIDKF